LMYKSFYWGGMESQWPSIPPQWWGLGRRSRPKPHHKRERVVMSSRSPRLSPYMTFSRKEWAKLRAAVPLPLSEEDLSALRGLNEPISLDEVTASYLPLARLLHMYVAASQSLYQVTDTFLGNLSPKVAY